ncbi:MAG: methanogenesis marker protein Mmp4/MtxX [Methanobrevibacter sp.]|nr:methanogenesis marker protein Mmp4/MtxX [Methanobrevibacter sp.]
MINIAIGLGKNKKVLLAIEEASKNENLHIKIAKNDEELLKAVKDRNIHAVIRGSLKSSIIKDLKELNNLEAQESEGLDSSSNNFKSINRASYIKKDKKEFLLAPVGIDEGETIEQKVEIAIQSFEFIKKCGKVPKIAILAGGRKEDFGRNKKIDKTLQDSEKLTDLLEREIEKIRFNNYSNSYLKEKIDFNNEYSIKNYYILIEKAVAEGNNIIIAPDGISGNLIFRTLVLLNSYNSYGAIALGFNKVFIDTSREQSKDGYLRALKLAYKLANNQKIIN